MIHSPGFTGGKSGPVDLKRDFGGVCFGSDQAKGGKLCCLLEWKDSEPTQLWGPVGFDLSSSKQFYGAKLFKLIWKEILGFAPTIWL